MSLWHRPAVAPVRRRQVGRRSVRRNAVGQRPVSSQHALYLLRGPQIPFRAAAARGERIVIGNAWPDAPYKGLNFYSTADAPLFSQREEEIDEVVALLASFDTRVVLLQGGTGTGKSSFLRAGLVPRLQSMRPDEGRRYFFRREAGAGSDARLIRPTDDPVARIYEALQSAATLESVPEPARVEIRRVLSQPIPQDRKAALPAIMAALKALTEPPQRD